jgi:Na+/proline symporter
MSLRSLSKAKLALTLSVFGLAGLFFINFYTGWMLFARYENCDPLKAGKIGGIDQLMPYYIMDTFGSYTAFTGIFVAGVFSASLGTVAACLSSLSAVTLEDLCISGLNVKITPEKSTRYAKWLNFGYGILSFGLIFLVEGKGILQATLTLNGLIGGIALGLFCLGIFFKRANLKGALYGGLISTSLVIALGICALSFAGEDEFLEMSVEGCSCAVNTTSSTPIPQISLPTAEPWYYIYKISYMWYSMIGTLLTIFFGYIASIIVQFVSDRNIKKLTSMAEKEETQGKFNKSASEQKISAIVQLDSETAAKIESTLRRAMSNSQTPHLRIIDDGDKMMILNEETLQVSTPMTIDSTRGTSVIQIFLDKKEQHLEGYDNPSLDLSNEDASVKKSQFIV